MRRHEDERIDRERLARFIAGECTDEEKAEIQAWIDARPSRSKLVASLSDVWRLSAAGEQWDVDSAWTELVERRAARLASPPKRVATWAVRAAAALVLVAGGAVVWSQLLRPEQTAESFVQREFTTGVAQQTDVQLPDGSTVTLAPQSQLRIGDDFGADAREVHLAGQAVFQATHDARRPFRVHTAGVSTEVLGTRFVVRAYADDPDISVALVDGSVRIRSSADSDQSRALTLRPGQVARAVIGAVPRVDDHANAAALLAWTEGQLVFKDTPLSQVARELGRWYDIDIRLADASLSERRLTATLGREPVDQVLELVVLSLDLRYERTGREIVFSTR